MDNWTEKKERQRNRETKAETDRLKENNLDRQARERERNREGDGVKTERKLERVRKRREMERLNRQRKGEEMEAKCNDMMLRTMLHQARCVHSHLFSCWFIHSCV